MNNITITDSQIQKFGFHPDFSNNEKIVNIQLRRDTITKNVSVYRLFGDKIFYNNAKQYTNTAKESILYSEYLCYHVGNKLIFEAFGRAETLEYINEMTFGNINFQKNFFTISNKTFDDLKKDKNSLDTDLINKTGLKLVPNNQSLKPLTFTDAQCRTIQEIYRNTFKRYFDMTDEKYNISKKMLLKLLKDNGHI